MSGPVDVINLSKTAAKPIAEPFFMGKAARTFSELITIYEAEAGVTHTEVPSRSLNLMWAQAFELTGNQKAADLEYELLVRDE